MVKLTYALEDKGDAKANVITNKPIINLIKYFWGYGTP
jgi:hypothetical protein